MSSSCFINVYLFHYVSCPNDLDLLTSLFSEIDVTITQAKSEFSLQNFVLGGDMNVIIKSNLQAPRYYY